MLSWSIVLETRFVTGSISWILTPPSHMPDGETAIASWPLRPLKELTSKVATTVFVAGSIFDRVPMPSLRTHTALFATATGSGVGVDQQVCEHGIGMVATTRSVRASIRATVAVRLIETHTVSPSRASPEGPP